MPSRTATTSSRECLSSRMHGWRGLPCRTCQSGAPLLMVVGLVCALLHSCGHAVQCASKASCWAGPALHRRWLLVFFSLGVNLLIGATPYVDNSGSVTGFVLGALLGLACILLRQQVGLPVPSRTMQHPHRTHRTRPSAQRHRGTYGLLWPALGGVGWGNPPQSA